MLHGWPGLATRDLVALSTRIVKEEQARVEFRVLPAGQNYHGTAPHNV